MAQTTLNQSQRKKLRFVLLLVFSVILVILSFLFSYKLALLVYPFNSEQQLIVDFLASPAELYDAVFQAGAAQNEMEHLQDVASLSLTVNILFIIEMILFLMLLVVSLRSKLVPLVKSFRLAGIGGITISVLLGLSSLFFFDETFEIFHRVFFPQGNYQFAFDSYLITTLPAELFFQIGLMIFSFVLVCNLGYLIISYLLKRKKKTK